MPSTLQAPEGFEPDTIPAGFELDSVPQGFEPDSSATTTATTAQVLNQPSDFISPATSIHDIRDVTRGGPPLSLPEGALKSVTGEIVEGIGETLTHPSPIPTPFTIDKNESPLIAAGKEVINLAVGIPQFFTSALGIEAAAAGAVAPTVVAGLFTADLLKSLGEQVQSSHENWSTMTPSEKTVAVTDMIGTGVFAGLTGKATSKGAMTYAEGFVPRGTGISPALAVLVPLTAQAAQAETTKESDSATTPRVAIESPTTPQQSLTPATDKAVSETPSQKPKVDEPAPEQPLETPSGGPALEAGVAAPQPSEFTPEQQARQDAARLETEANLRRELEGGDTGIPTRFGEGGPGSASAGQPGTYEPAVELSDALKTVREPDPLTRAQVMEKMTDVWEAGKTTAQKAWGRVVAAKESIKSNLTTLPEATPVKRLVAALDFQIQKSSAMSRDLGKTFETSHPNRTRRNGIAVFVDSGLDPAKVQAAIAQLPANTPRKIRKAFEAAADLNPAERDTAERIKHYFDQRLQDAQQAGVLDRFLEDYYTHVWKRPERMPEELKNAMSNGRVVSYFENARERKLDDFITGVKLGLEPVLDPAAVVPRYNFNLDRAIASRAFVKKLSETTEADGRPTVAPRGTGEVVQGSGNPATIIRPNSKAGEAADYQEVNNPALRKWKWATNSPDGSPVLVEGDLVVHPDAAQRIKNIMERERLTASTPMRVAIRAGAEVKGAKLGVLSPFHQIHVGSHALFHLVNPFSLKPELDWSHPATKFAVEQGGLKLSADFHDKTAFTEGLAPGLIAQKIVPYARAYSEYLFESFIPRLKLKTFEAAYNRNIWARDNLPGAVTGLKGLSDAQIAARAGDSVNNAYGELNRLWLGKNGRDPRLQRAMQVTLLAPDFLEARGRFLAKALTKTGFEERMALFVMGASLYTLSRVMNQLIDGDPHMEPGMMFSVRKGDTNYSIRSVLGDTEHALTDWRSFIAHRINPLTTRTAVELITRRDIKTGESRTTIEQFQDLLDQVRPSQVDSMFDKDREWYDGLVQSIGLTKRHQPTPEELKKREVKAEKEAKHPSKVEIIYKKGFSHKKPLIKPTPK